MVIYFCIDFNFKYKNYRYKKNKYTITIRMIREHPSLKTYGLFKDYEN